MTILSIRNLKKIYHTKQGETLAVDNFSFDLDENEFVAIVGPSGCGKSTILSILCGLDDASSGDIVLADNLKLGYMLQGDNLFEWQTIFKNCLLGLEINKEVSAENKEYVKKLLKTYGLEDFMTAYPSNLSGGMRQRVSLIRTLATKPDLLILDEPFSALDYQSRLAVSDDVYRIIKKEGKSAIMVTHDISEAISMADKVIVLSKRPSVIKNIYEINLANKSTPINNRKAKEFAKYYDMIWKDIDYHV
ncbi:MAG: ABC transporter ATP-binding protein [Bacilli bacterium]|nr:ABC transporter ATP-binding protein [Bacilli bacterium]